MDTSEIYVKMCDCDEVQGHWKKEQYGDILACYDKKKIYENGSHYYTLLLAGGPPIRKSKNRTWLPRQDQIQAMLIKEKFGAFDAHWDMCIDIPAQFVAQNPDLELSSMEQIWLSCYMLAIHKKKWDGEKWHSG